MLKGEKMFCPYFPYFMSVSIEYDAENLDTVWPLEIMLFKPIG